MTGPDLPPPGSIPSYPGSSQPQPSAPPPQPPGYHAPQGGGAPPPMPGPGGSKKTPWPWILGGCGGCLVLIVIGTVIAFALMVPTARKIIREAQASAPSPRVEGAILFTNERSNTPEGLKEHFSRFSFQYPSHFQVVPDTANFIKVEEQEDGFTLENFAVGYMTAPPGTGNEAAYPALMQQLSQQIAQGFQNYRELDQFPETVGGVPGRGMHWQATAKNTPKGDVQFFGHVILARKQNREKGVAIIMIATNLDPDVEGPQDVGTKGDLAEVLASFRLE